MATESTQSRTSDEEPDIELEHAREKETPHPPTTPHSCCTKRQALGFLAGIAVLISLVVGTSVGMIQRSAIVPTPAPPSCEGFDIATTTEAVFSKTIPTCIGQLERLRSLSADRRYRALGGPYQRKWDT